MREVEVTRGGGGGSRDEGGGSRDGGGGSRGGCYRSPL